MSYHLLSLRRKVMHCDVVLTQRYLDQFQEVICRWEIISAKEYERFARVWVRFLYCVADYDADVPSIAALRDLAWIDYSAQRMIGLGHSQWSSAFENSLPIYKEPNINAFFIGEMRSRHDYISELRSSLHREYVRAVFEFQMGRCDMSIQIIKAQLARLEVVYSDVL